MNDPYRRWRLVKLIQPGLQLRHVLAFTGISVLSFVLQPNEVTEPLRRRRWTRDGAARPDELGSRAG